MAYKTKLGVDIMFEGIKTIQHYIALAEEGEKVFNEIGGNDHLQEYLAGVVALKEAIEAVNKIAQGLFTNFGHDIDLLKVRLGLDTKKNDVQPPPIAH